MEILFFNVAPPSGSAPAYGSVEAGWYSAYPGLIPQRASAPRERAWANFCRACRRWCVASRELLVASGCIFERLKNTEMKVKGCESTPHEPSILKVCFSLWKAKCLC